MSDILNNEPNSSMEAINAYYDGAAAGLRLYATWSDGRQYVGVGRRLSDALQDIEELRQRAIDRWRVGDGKGDTAT